MNAEAIALIIKIITLIILVGIAELSLNSRKFSLCFFVTAVYFSLLRRSFLNAIALYVGLFQKSKNTAPLQTVLMNGWVVLLTDSLILISSIFMLIFIVKELHKIYNYKGVKK